MEERYQIIVIGGGPAGLAAAAAAKENGEDSVLILERDRQLGGILNQCIHNGFGLHTFREELTGPEYADRFIRRVQEHGIEYRLHTMVLDISPAPSDGDAAEKGSCQIQKTQADTGAAGQAARLSGRDGYIVTAVSRETGLTQIRAKAVILAMGCRERPRGALNIPGYRPAGIYTAGTAQRLVNIEGLMPGREVVILGSGDIGLIMARRLTLEGARVKVVAELMPYSGGLKRNIVQCLDDFGIPLKLNHTVVDIEGRDRVTGITIAEVDGHGKPISGTEEYYSCDMLMLSCGLIPENELSGKMGVELSPVTRGPVVNECLETSLPGVFACGNVLHVHDLVDYVSEEAAAAGRNAAEYVRSLKLSPDGQSLSQGPDDHSRAQNPDNQLREITVECRDGVRYTVPSRIRPDYMPEQLVIRFRVGNVYRDHSIAVYLDDECLMRRKRRIMAPGEMEQVILKKEEITDRPDLQTVRICLEADSR